MRLIIAEKPSVAQAIASLLGGAKRAKGHIVCAGETNVTWCFGHLLETASPEDYVGNKIKVADLPVIPREWILTPRDGGAGKQVKVVRDLLKCATEVINAGDADREGQLLVDEVLIHLNWQGKTLRLWLSSLDDDSVRRALATLKSNDAMRPLYYSALARQQADWLKGMNASIAISRNLQSLGVSGAWSVGRVQTPTLALLVDRMRAIAGFRPRDHYLVQAEMEGGIMAAWQIPEDLLTDGLLLERSPATVVAEKIVGQIALVDRFTIKTGERAAPMPYMLSTLQKIVNRKLGLSASDTLAAAQELYEAKVTTYPRTDCTWLPEELHSDAPRIIKTLDADMTGIDVERRHSAWNSGKVEAHHGIIPTGQRANGSLSANAQGIFALIRESYLRLFMLPERFETREAIFVMPEGEHFRATARIVLGPGWTALSGIDEEDDDQESTTAGKLPVLVKGQTLLCGIAGVVAKRTSPPKHYNDGTLITAMTSIHKLVTDPKLKARLKETAGLGTEATRAGMIEVLIRREYAERHKKEIHATERGLQLIDMLRRVAPELTDPGMTALQEDSLADIATGRGTFEEFMREQVESVRKVTRTLITGRLLDRDMVSHECPACRSEHCIRLTSKAGRPYHRCKDCECAFSDEGGKPGKPFEDRQAEGNGQKREATPASGPPCLTCKKATFKNETKTGKAYYRCGSCKTAWWPDRKNEGNLGLKWEG